MDIRGLGKTYLLLRLATMHDKMAHQKINSEWRAITLLAKLHPRNKGERNAPEDTSV